MRAIDQRHPRALEGRSFDLVYAMYGRLRDLARFFAGRCARMMAVGGVPADKGFAQPQNNWPPGMLVPMREDAQRAVDDDNVKVRRIVQTEDAFFEAHPNGTSSAGTQYPAAPQYPGTTQFP